MEFRKKEKDAFVYGIHPVLEALQSGKTVDKVWLQEGVLQGQLKDLLPLLRAMKKKPSCPQFTPTLPT